MAARARRGKTRSAKSPHDRLGDEGAERYIWVFPEEDRVVLTIPGLRDLKLSVTDARAIGEILIQTADEITSRDNQTGSGDSNGGTEEHPAQG